MGMRKWHRLLGLLVAVPCLLWSLSGGLLAWKNWARPTRDTVAKPQQPKRAFQVSVDQTLKMLGRPEQPQSVSWIHVVGLPRLLVRFEQAPQVLLVDGESGQLAAPVDVVLATQIAEQEAPVGVVVASAQLQTQPTLVYPAFMELPAFRIGLSSGDDVYVSPKTGEVLAHVDTLFRIIRVAFFGLHIWKFSSAGTHAPSFLLLMVMAGVLFCSATTGLWVLLRRGRARGRSKPAPSNLDRA